MLRKKVNIEIVLIFIIIFISKETLMFGSNIDKTVVFFRNIIMLVLFPISYYLYKKKRITASKLSNVKWGVIILLCILIILSGLFGIGGLELAYFIKVTMILTGVYLTCAIPYKNFCIGFEKIIVFISVISLIAYVVNTVSPAVIHVFPLLENTSHLYFNNLFLTVIPNFEYDRLFGPFREPGVYAIYLCFALYLHVVNNEKLSIRIISVLISAILISKSTAGYILLLIVLLLFLTKSGNEKLPNKYFIILLLIVAFYYIYNNTDLLLEDGDVLGKFSAEGSESQISRFGSLYGNILIIKDYPLFGIGMSGIIDLFPKYCQLAVGYPSEFNTNTILMQFSVHGIIYGALFCFFYFRFFFKKSNGKLAHILSALFGFLLLSGENVCDNLLLYVMFGYGIVLSNNINIAKTI